jgi:hypothetical protein
MKLPWLWWRETIRSPVNVNKVNHYPFENLWDIFIFLCIYNPLLSILFLLCGPILCSIIYIFCFWEMFHLSCWLGCIVFVFILHWWQPLPIHLSSFLSIFVLILSISIPRNRFRVYLWKHFLTLVSSSSILRSIVDLRSEFISPFWPCVIYLFFLRKNYDITPMIANPMCLKLYLFIFLSLFPLLVHLAGLLIDIVALVASLRYAS